VSTGSALRPTPVLALRLATRAAAIDVAAAPEPVRQRLTQVVVHVLTAGLAAVGRPDVTAARRALLSGAGPSTVMGYPPGAAPAMAALANALPVAAEQRQDGHRRARGHPASHLVPAVLAVAEAAGSTGRATGSAILAGYEVGARLGAAQGGTPAGVHDIATWALPATAAGVAHLLSGGDPEVVAAALDLAASVPVLPSADMVFHGATGQHLLLALGAQLGVVWGQTAAAGLRPEPGALEHHYSRFSAARWEPGLADGPQPWAVLEGYLKRHPTCAHLHGVNDAVEDLLAGAPLDPSDVAGVEVRTYRAAAAFAEVQPLDDLSARFSIPWTVAVALLRGDLEAGGFGPAALADPLLRSLAQRVQVRADPSLEAGYPDGRPATVVVTLTDGSTRTAHAGRPRGDGPDALTVPDVVSGPRNRLTALVGPTATDALLGAVHRLAEDGPGPVAAALGAAGALAADG
jgi:2-methylcitrate dehydratase PrpD